MKHKLRSILFDFDYTLADPSPGVEACLNYALGRLGLPVASSAQIRQTVGLSLSATFLQLAGSPHLARYDEFLQLFVSRADEVMANSTTVFESVPTVVNRLGERGFRLGIVSMKYGDHITPVLQRERLLDAFEVIIGGDEVAKPKPDPEGINLALARLGSSPATAIYVGDSVIDAETAIQAGLQFIAVLSGSTPRDAFKGYDGCQILDDISELSEWVSPEQTYRDFR